MKIKRDLLQERLTQLINKWDISGNTYVIEHNKVLFNASSGYDDRDKNIKKDETSPYTFSYKDRLFVGLSIFLLIDQNVLKLEDSLDQYLPEYKHASKITISDLLRDESGIKDYFHNDIMLALENDEKFMASPIENRLLVEKEFFLNVRSYERVMTYISDADLEYKPGTKDEDGSASNMPFLEEIVKRTTQMNVFEFLSEHLFKPLGMDTVKNQYLEDNISYTMKPDKTLLKTAIPYPGEDLITLMPEDLHKLVNAFVNQAIFSKKLWKKILKFDHHNMGLLFTNVNGFICIGCKHLGFSINLYIRPDLNLGFSTLNNEDIKVVYEQESWQHFRKDLRGCIADFITYPTNTKIVPLSKKNFWDAKDLTVSKKQLEYVLDAKTSIGMASVYKTNKTYVQMEGDISVGLLVLDIDKKKNNYYISIILVDEKYQGRGYGKLIVEFAVNTLKAAGAKKLTIGVARENVAAKKIYMNAGFEPFSVDQEGMELQLILNE